MSQGESLANTHTLRLRAPRPRAPSPWGHPPDSRIRVCEGGRRHRRPVRLIPSRLGRDTKEGSTYRTGELRVFAVEATGHAWEAVALGLPAVFPHLHVIAQTTEERPDDMNAERWSHEKKLPCTVLLDEDARIGTASQVQAPPYFLVADKNGVTVAENELGDSTIQDAMSRLCRHA